MLETLDTYLRLIIIGQLSVIGLVAWRGVPGRLGTATGLLVICIACYVLASSPLLQLKLIVLVPLLVAGGTAVPYALWWFASVVFEFRLPHRAWLLLPAWATLDWLVFLAPGDLGTPEVILGVVTRVASLIVVSHILYAVLVDRRDDLFEPRRRFRPLFFGLVAGVVFITVVVELVLMGPAPMWLQLFSAVYIAVLTLSLGVPVARGNLAAVEPEKPPAPPEPDQALKAALLNAMADRAYATPGLTVEQLAERLGASEAALRRLINGALGFRNFSTFVNGYRIEEAARRLRDPDEARLPVLTIALDVGFGSIGPFNRAFKQLMDTTPTDYRKGE